MPVLLKGTRTYVRIDSRRLSLLIFSRFSGNHHERVLFMANIKKIDVLGSDRKKDAINMSTENTDKIRCLSILMFFRSVLA